MSAARGDYGPERLKPCLATSQNLDIPECALGFRSGRLGGGNDQNMHPSGLLMFHAFLPETGRKLAGVHLLLRYPIACGIPATVPPPSDGKCVIDGCMHGRDVLDGWMNGWLNGWSNFEATS